MTGEGETRPVADALPLADDDLDGHTMDELVDYLDAGRTPPDPTIESSPGRQIALAGLSRLRDTYSDLLDTEATAADLQDDSWVAGILAHIDTEAHAGRDVPLPHPDPAAHLALTEGAVRGVIRAAGDATDGFVIGRVRLIGDVDLLDAPVVVHIDARVLAGHPIPAGADALRAAVTAELARHTYVNISAIDITVTDLQLDDPRQERR